MTEGYKKNIICEICGEKILNTHNYPKYERDFPQPSFSFSSEKKYIWNRELYMLCPICGCLLSVNRWDSGYQDPCSPREFNRFTYMEEREKRRCLISFHEGRKFHWGSWGRNF